MNIKRGLFRLWIVFTVLWIGGACWGYGAIWRSAIKADAVDASAKAAASVSTPRPALSAPVSSASPPAYDQFAAAGFASVASAPAATPTASPAFDPFDAIGAGTQAAAQAPAAMPPPLSHSQEFWAGWQGMASVTFLPPTALMLAALVLRWVAKGFHS